MEIKDRIGHINFAVNRLMMAKEKLEAGEDIKNCDSFQQNVEDAIIWCNEALKD